jgi:hypothetical protein
MWDTHVENNRIVKHLIVIIINMMKCLQSIEGCRCYCVTGGQTELDSSFWSTT